MSREPTLYTFAREELERANGDRAQAIDALVRRLFDDENLRRDLAAPILRNIVAGTVGSIINRNRRGPR